MKDMVITEETRAAVVQCCAGRPCLSECLERLCLASRESRLCASAAGVAGEAHVRDSVACGLPARSRKGVFRGLPGRALKAFVRLVGRLRIVRAARARFTLVGVMALFALALLSPARADLKVDWITDDVIMVSGYGSGGVGGGENITVVVTNILGVCTNCLGITKEDFDMYMENVIAHNIGIDNSCILIQSLVTNLLQNIDREMSEIAEFYRSSWPQVSIAESFSDVTNYAYSSNNPQSELIRSYLNGKPPVGNYRYSTIGYNDGIYDYAYGYVLPSLSQYRSLASDIQTKSSIIKLHSENIDYYANSLIKDAGPCECSSNSNSCVNGPDGSGGVSQDQLDAIIDYLKHIDQDQHKRYDQLLSISNDVFSIRQKCDEYARRMVDAIYGTGLGLPDDAEPWSTVYLRQEPTDWGYNPTNVLSRIELLLAGISGVQSNAAHVASDLLDDTLSEQTSNQYSRAYSDLESDIQSSSQNAVSSYSDFSTAISGFFRKFSSLSGDDFSQQVIVPSATIDIAGEQYDVPALTLDEPSRVQANIVQSVCRTVASCLYWLAAGFAGFRFYGWFLSRVGSIIKWSVELLQGLFA